jgi:hypothetical protein
MDRGLPVMFMLVILGGLAAAFLFGSHWLVRKLFYQLGGSAESASRLTAALQQTLHVLVWIAFPLAWAWVGAHELGYATAAYYLGYLAGAAFLTAAVVFALFVLVLWFFVEEDDRAA